MTTYICLLRGINVGGNKRMKMADLRELLDSLGLSDVQTVLQSGNVVFHSDESDRAALADTIEAGIQEKFGFESRIILRTADEWRAAIENHPFSEDQMADQGKLLLTCFTQPPAPDAIAALMEAHSGPEEIHIAGSDAYAFYPNGMGRSKLTHNVIEKHLKVIGTGRNWKTVHRLNDLI